MALSYTATSSTEMMQEESREVKKAWRCRKKLPHLCHKRGPRTRGLLSGFYFGLTIF